MQHDTISLQSKFKTFKFGLSNQARVKSEDVFCMSGITRFERIRNGLILRRLLPCSL